MPITPTSAAALVPAMTGFSCDAGMLNLRAVSEAAAHPSGTRETSDETLMLAYAAGDTVNDVCTAVDEMGGAYGYFLSENVDPGQPVSCG